jgi:hypothetical protein
MAPAIDAGVVNVAVFQRLALPRMVVKSKLVLSREQRDRLLSLAETRGRDLHLLLALGLLAGLRRSEILAITWADVDIENCTLVVRNGVNFTSNLANPTFSFTQGSLNPYTIFPYCIPVINLTVTTVNGCTNSATFVADTLRKPTAWFNKNKGCIGRSQSTIPSL